MEFWHNKAFNSIDYHRKQKASNISNQIQGQCKACWDYNETKSVHYLYFLKNWHRKYVDIYHPTINVKPYDMIPYIHYYPVDNEGNPLKEPPKYDPYHASNQAILPKVHYPANKWGNQQKRDKIEIKRAFGRYYRMKENKTWKWKLSKRRKSKRRELKRSVFYDDFYEMNFTKMTQIVIKQNTNYQMTSYCNYDHEHYEYWYDCYYNYNDIDIYRICIECDGCYALIYISNRREFSESNGNNMYHYFVDDDKINANNKRYFHFIYGKYRRIFCDHCAANKIIGCSFVDCEAKEINPKLCKWIEINDEANHFYGQYFICDNHQKCESCDKEFSYHPIDYWTLNEYKVQKCSDCNKYVCGNCILHGICILCIDKNQFNILYHVLSNIFDIKVINVIKEYCSGYFMTKCCAVSEFKVCSNSIFIKDILSLTGDTPLLYSYVARDYASKYAVDLFNQQLIIFCQQCTKYKLQKCQYSYCNNKAAFYAICQLHPCCNICVYRPYEYGNDLTLCPICREHICSYCIFDGICKTCIKKTELQRISDILDCRIGNILNINLINIIAFHCTGYFEVSCCNLYDCDAIIKIQDVDSLIRCMDDQKRIQSIYFYKANKYSLSSNSVFIYGYQLIMFCRKCTRKKLKKCEYHKFTFERSFGNNIYNKARCYNLEASHVICQIHPNHHKIKSKPNMDHVIEKMRKFKRMQKLEDRQRNITFTGKRNNTFLNSDWYTRYINNQRRRESEPRRTPITNSEYMRIQQKYKTIVARNNKLKSNNYKIAVKQRRNIKTAFDFSDVVKFSSIFI